MSTTEIKLQILLESFPLKCKYYEESDIQCRKTRVSSLPDYRFANCGGNIGNCDLKQEEVDKK